MAAPLPSTATDAVFGCSVRVSNSRWSPSPDGKLSDGFGGGQSRRMCREVLPLCLSGWLGSHGALLCQQGAQLLLLLHLLLRGAVQVQSPGDCKGLCWWLVAETGFLFFCSCCGLKGYSGLRALGSGICQSLVGVGRPSEACVSPWR